MVHGLVHACVRVGVHGCECTCMHVRASACELDMTQAWGMQGIGGYRDWVNFFFFCHHQTFYRKRTKTTLLGHYQLPTFCTNRFYFYKLPAVPPHVYPSSIPSSWRASFSTLHVSLFFICPSPCHPHLPGCRQHTPVSQVIPLLLVFRHRPDIKGRHSLGHPALAGGTDPAGEVEASVGCITRSSITGVHPHNAPAPFQHSVRRQVDLPKGPWLLLHKGRGGGGDEEGGERAAAEQREHKGNEGEASSEGSEETGSAASGLAADSQEDAQILPWIRQTPGTDVMR